MDAKKLKQLQQQYNDEEYQEGDEEADELLQDNSDMYDQEAYETHSKPAGNSNQLSGVITQVDKGASQPNVQQEDDIPGDFFVQNEIVIGAQRKCDQGKKTFALDLDETLVHSSFEPVEGADLLLPVEIEGTVHKVYVKKRPGVDDFLKRLHKHYELIIYTASLSKYADPLLDWLDPKNYCGYRLFREHCTYVNGIFVKDLSRLDRPLKDCMIIDNSPTSYLFHPECAIPTVSWYSDQSDMELYQLCSILEKIAYVDDVRPYLKQFISNNKVNFSKAAKVIATIQVPADNSHTDSPKPSGGSKDKSPSPSRGPVKAHQQQVYTNDDRQSDPTFAAQNQGYRTADERNSNNVMMNQWMANTGTEDQYKKLTMMNQYKNMGLNQMNTDMQKLLSSTLSSQANAGRNYDREHKRSTSKKHSRTANNSAHAKRSHSKRRKSPFRGRNDNSFGIKTGKYDDANSLFLSMIKNSLRPKSKHRGGDDSMNVSKGRDTTITSFMPQTMSHLGRTSVKKSRSRHPRTSSSPKRASIKYSKTIGRTKGGSTRVSRKGSTANSRERGSYTTYVSQRTSPKSKKNKVSMDYNSSNKNSFKFNNMMQEMGMLHNYNNYPQNRQGVRSRQGNIGSKKSSMIDSMIGNANKARERAQKMYSATNIHTPTPSNDGLLFNDSKRGGELLMMGANNNHHQHIYKVNSTGRGKTPHQKPGSVKRRKTGSSNKRSHSRPRSSKNSGAGKHNAFQAKFFDPKLMLNSYNM